METCSKPNVKALSIAQIVISVTFFLLGTVDGSFIEDIYVRLIFLPCWVGALVLPVGVMGLRLTSYQRPRTLQLLKHAIWSLCVACIICSALTVYIYTTHGLLIIQQFALTVKYTGRSTREDAGLFVAELQGDKMVYTEKKKTALAFFSFVIICSVIEIVLAAAMMKICKTPRLSSSSSGYYQMGDSQQSPQAYPIEQQQISATQQSLQADPAVEQRVHVDFRDNQASYNDVMNH
ncbi:uncharacterized protein LOC114960546 [Acropora millepora]|uniref:uncharacterized protein LOC114960546 n=1 Tax=Acropora millepora TaxID=45264 RepID=UPI001CF35BB0|nr:uncharacterized protein LOC114960546 [Acropora millepora]XP_044181615.1 uncharacterized protein LOC114960546 [Acropora millepora]